ncbi:MAG: DegT/DnrJ/EryC1/StrS family aminotransferase [Pirellulales bacterium]|nr:DegT/DnrJ/EryC1/StrS family aminotransferase [Pirellulales bacterium]
MTEKLAIVGGTPVRTDGFPAWPCFGEPEEQRLLAALRSGAWGKLQGTHVAQFERQFAEYHEAWYGFAVVNGTAALKIALLAAGIQAGDEVIITPYSFFATASAVVEANATPVFADIELETSNIDPASIEEAITPRTAAIIVVHLGGLPCDMDAILEIAQRHNLTVIEDACHAVGAEYKGRRVGAIGHLGCFSFQSSKNLPCGEGGIVLTNHKHLAERCWSLHNCGRVPDGKWYEHHMLGTNCRLGELQGALLLAQWERLEEQIATREQNGLYLDQRFAEMDAVTPQRRTNACTRHGYHIYSLRIDPARWGLPRDVPRDVIVEAIRAEGIPALAGYPIPLYRQPAFLKTAFGPYTGYRDVRPELDYVKTDCPRCEILSTEQGIWIEHRALLGTQRDMDDIVTAVNKVFENRGQLQGDGQRSERASDSSGRARGHAPSTTAALPDRI